uniref:hypothetical protein n=1 Tax=Polaromonas sp. TaxID=1869339 RepID=UPI004035241D
MVDVEENPQFSRKKTGLLGRKIAVIFDFRWCSEACQKAAFFPNVGLLLFGPRTTLGRLF